MSILGAALRLNRKLPLGLAVRASQASVVLYLSARPSLRREISENYERLLGQRDQRFWYRQALCLGRNLAIMAHIGQPPLDKLLDNAAVTGENILEQIMLTGNGALVATLHYGLWELLPQLFARRGYKVCVATERQRDTDLDSVLSPIRLSNGVITTDEIQLMRQVLRSPGLVGFALDNSHRTSNERCDAVWPGFCVTRTPFALSRREKMPVVPIVAFSNRTACRLEAYVGQPVRTAHEFGEWMKPFLLSEPEQWVFWGKTRDRKSEGATTAELRRQRSCHKRRANG